MPLKVGIPRALLAYYYYPLWKTFLENLGAEVVLSSPTNKRILDQGTKSAVDEACLPVKVFYGHVLALREQVDFLFVPRLVSVEAKRYICPKVMGLPDMLRANIPFLPPLIDTTVDISKKPKLLWRAVTEVGKFFTRSSQKIKMAWQQACTYYHCYLTLMQKYLLLPPEAESLLREASEAKGEAKISFRHAREEENHPFQIALIGHNYDLYDRYVSMDLVQKLRRQGVKIRTADQIPPEVIDAEAAKLPKRLFWTLGKQEIGAILYFLTQPEIDGVIHLASFGCGPDSLVGNLIERFVRREGRIPFLYLTVDEHTGEAGILTRLEAFLDMLSWRQDCK